ncbi:MAG: hypothetical protein JWM19_941 [Actinomycetia bacterium]|nr:hypothetical protein [Actinomycetes bacterium]
MEIRECQCAPACEVHFGTCHCGCGTLTTISSVTNNRLGYVKGQPVRFVRGHANGQHHELTEVNAERRTATCSKCGPVTIKIHGDGWRCTRTLTIEHRLSEVDEASRTAWCVRCDTRVEVTLHRKGTRMNWICAPANRARMQAYRDANPEKIAAGHEAWREANREYLREYHRQRRYGLTPEQFTELLTRQEGHCLFCPRVTGNTRNKVLHVDHDEESGIIRGGLLCDRCNRALGYADHDIARLREMADYLEAFEQRLQARTEVR